MIETRRSGETGVEYNDIDGLIEIQHAIDYVEGASVEDIELIYSRAIESVRNQFENNEIDIDGYTKRIEYISQMINQLLKTALLSLQESKTDKRTGLPTADAFRESLNKMIEKQKNIVEETKRETEFLTVVVYIDLDNLKPLNDSLGHGAGDKALELVGDTIQSLIREGDLFVSRDSLGNSSFGRVGGDEFIIVIDKAVKADDDPDELSDEVNRIIETFRAKFTDLEIRYEGKTYKTDVSLGFAYTIGLHQRDIDTVINEADKDMIQKKQNSKRT